MKALASPNFRQKKKAAKPFEKRHFGTRTRASEELQKVRATLRCSKLGRKQNCDRSGGRRKARQVVSGGVKEATFGTSFLSAETFGLPSLSAS
jgi:hypothetical protein